MKSAHPKLLEGSKQKVERAKEHISQLEAEIQEFLGREPYRIVLEEEQQNGDLIYRVKIKEQPPLRWSAIIGDIVHNLRSALDLLANDVVSANCKIPNHYTAFPVCKSAKDFEDRLPKMVRGASTEAIRIIKSLKPYKGGNEELWRIHHLDIVDKHRLILSVGTMHRNVVMSSKIQVPWGEGEKFQFPPFAINPADRQYPLKDNAEVMRVKAAARKSDSGFSMDYKFTFDVAFGDEEVVQGEPVFPALKRLISYVEGIIGIFDSYISSLPLKAINCAD